MQYQTVEQVITNFPRMATDEKMRHIKRIIGRDPQRLRALRSAIDQVIAGRIATVGELLAEYEAEVVLRCVLGTD